MVQQEGTMMKIASGVTVESEAAPQFMSINRGP